MIGRLFGLRRSQMPASLAELEEYGRRDARPVTSFTSATGRAAARARSCSSHRCRTLARPLLETVNFITIALLPDAIRSQYGFSPLPPTAVRKALVGAGAAYVRRGVLPVLPAHIRQVPAARQAA